MTFKEKIAAYEKILLSKGEKKSNISPPIYRLAWKLGFELPPPVFGSFVQNMVVQGSLFGIGWGVLMWLIVWGREGKSIYVAIIASLFAGILFGTTMAFLWKKKNAKLGLGSWETFPDGHEDVNAEESE